MLGKLLKYEIRATARIFLPILGMLLGLAVLNRLTMSLIPNDSIFNGVKVILMTLYVLMILGAFVLCIVVAVQRFYKNLLGEEGYLMFTLPVTTTSLILSKGLTALLWGAVTLAASFLSLMILLPGSALPELISRISQARAEALQYGFNMDLIFAEIAILLCVALVALLMQIYVSISIGQLSNNHKLGVAFGVYIGLYAAMQILMLIILGIILSGPNSLLARMPELIQQNNATETMNLTIGFVSTILLAVILVDAALSVVYFFVSRRLLHTKLNLE